VIPALHYALKPGSYLLLGGAENLGAFAEYFVPVDKKNKIYQKKKSTARLLTHFAGIDYGIRRKDAKTGPDPQPVSTVDKEADRMLLDRFVPASIVVNDEMEIVRFRGKTAPYLEPPSGQPTFSLSKMAREGLLVDLRAAWARARKENTTVRRAGVQHSIQRGYTPGRP
jgi:two-component system CheB/CheR fusion protein